MDQEKGSSQSEVSQFGDPRPPQLPQDAPQPAIALVAVWAWVAHTVTLRWCYYSTTSIWDKLLSDPERSQQELSESGEFA
jgi:hypothetical protein